MAKHERDDFMLWAGEMDNETLQLARDLGKRANWDTGWPETPMP